jgi:hypothetical protein
MRTAFFWRLKPQFYRLQGVRFANGEVSLQDRPVPVTKAPVKLKTDEAKVEFVSSLYLKNAS